MRADSQSLILDYEEYDQNHHSLEDMLINDRLSVKKEIGKGSVGRVYKTIDLELKKYVALKVFDKRSSKVKYDKKGLANFNRLIKTEGEILRKFDHDHIIKCYGVYENPDFTILSTQYCNEGTLFEEITKRKVLYEEDAISIIKQITIGLAEIHSKNIIHRDLKPENIFKHNGYYKIGDFGFAKIVPSEEQIHTDLGTQWFAAPQILHREPSNMKADIYSLGVIFYQLICATYEVEDRPKRVFRKEWQSFYLRDKKPPSQLTMDFLRKCLTPKQKRMDWIQLKNHPIFQQEKESISAYYRISVISLTSLKVQSFVSEQQYSFDSEFEIYNVDVDERQSEKLEMSPTKVTNDTGISNDLEEEIYFQLINCNLCCLKANYIYLNYMRPLQKEPLHNIDKRQAIEMMYLLSARCYLYVSRIKNYAKKYRESELTKELLNFIKSVEGMYETMKERFNHYQSLITKQEGKYLEIIKDKFRNHQEKDIILCGIESIDYTVEKHVQFTQVNYLLKHLNKINCKSESTRDQLIGRFKSYSRINAITNEDIFNEKFQKIANRIVDQSNQY